MSLPGRRLHKSNPWQLRVRERRILLVIGDLIVAMMALVIALYIWGSRLVFIEFDLIFLRERVPFWFYLMPFIWLILLVELYDVQRAGNWRQTVRGIASAALIGFILYLVVYFYYTDPGNRLPRVSVAVFLVSVSLLTLAWRRLYIRLYTTPALLRRVLVVGGGKAGQTILQVINDLWPPPFFVVGIIDDDPQKAASKIEGVEVVGTSDTLLKIIEEQNISDILVAISGEMHGHMFQVLLDAQERGIGIVRMPTAYEELLGRVPIRHLETDWILRSFVDEARVSGFFELMKRILDIIGGFIGVVIFLLLLPFIAIAILLDDGRPIFYVQIRSGKGAQPYRIIKLRTMHRDAEYDGQPRWATEDDTRATRVGRLLRKTHLDELPQFLNVLRGEMSLVGPRAERPALVELFENHVPFYRARLLVKPGITGWAQINYGYASTIDETIKKLEYDLYYIKHRNVLMEILIIIRTPATVLGFRGR
ncbi:MAG: sugar transferase [Anaerolineales bacterium]|jgi:exopolysaccharide biosynthesis polyprenyl glycosylphosphotransferase